MKRTHLIAYGLFLLPATYAFAAPSAQIELSSVSVHLFLDSTGEFTNDVTIMRGFGARNFRPFADGEDFGGSNFHALLVKITFKAPVETYEKTEIAQVTLSDADTKKPILRQAISNLYIGANGRTTVPIFVSGHECQTIKVVVKSGETSIQKVLPFSCGE
jgi:hypothetical protein